MAKMGVGLCGKRAAMAGMLVVPVAPKISAIPYRKNAVAKEPSRKYLSAASGPLRVAFADAGHDVGGDRGYFQSDEDQQQFGGGGHEQHAGRAEDDQRKELALVIGRALHGVERDEQGDQDDSADHYMKEGAEGVGLHQAAVGGPGYEQLLLKAGKERGKHSENGQPSQRLAACRGAEASPRSS